MHRIISFAFIFGAGCALTGSLVPGFTSSSSSPSSPAVSPAPRLAAASPGLSDYATRYINGTHDVSSKCPLDGEPPDDWGHVCWMNGDNLDNLYKWVDDGEKSNGQVQKAHVYLASLHTTVARWKTEAKTAERKKHDDSRRDAAVGSAEHQADDLLGRLREGRDGKTTSTLISFDNRDAGYVKDRLDSLREELPIVEQIGQGCAKGGGNQELCDLAKNRDAYFSKFEALQWDKILGERLEAWTNTIRSMKDDGEVAVVNYNVITNSSKLASELGKELGAIGDVLGQTNTKASIDAKLAKLHADFAAALASHLGTNAWAEHATEATYSDAAVTQAVRGIPGLSLVRVGVVGPTWEVVRGQLDQPVQRNRYAWAMLRKSGERFCRLYQMAVIEDHMGGGRYGAPRVDAGDAPSFYVSTCK
ncbi:MAG TPA: hypothetical protein VGF94_20500 [Kofleriaceae bacterium]|jgi:hypothetical protein